MKTLSNLKPKEKKVLQKAKNEVQSKQIDSTPTYDDEVYSPEFVAKILQSREDIKNGKGTEMTLEEFKALCE